MRNTNATLAAMLIGLCVSSAGLARADAGDVFDHFDELDNKEGAAPTGKCVHVTTSTPYRGFGYDHVVDIENTCDKPQICRVKTNVTPEVQIVKLAAGQSISVTTFRGSPAREFKADVECNPESKRDS